MKPNSKEVTIYDIAKKLGISTTTVSRGLRNNPTINIRTRKKIQETARELGYRQNLFASNLRLQKTNTIGLIMHEVRSSFMTSVLSGIEKVTTEAGYDIIITHSSESYEKEVANAANLFHKRVDGVIASLSFGSNDLSHFRQFEEKGIPVIFFDRVDEGQDFTKVVIDNYKNGYDATQHLIEQGCKRIALFTADLARNVYGQRHKGYADALRDNHLSYNKHLVLVKDLSEKAAIDAAAEMLKMKPRPDGVFVTNDASAALLMQQFKQAGVDIPKDIAIVGFNNDMISRVMEPQLSTIDYPGYDMGEIAARNLINHLSGVANLKQTRTVVMNSSLIVRKSSMRKINGHHHSN
jgi:LacI family transcriptional regulator